MTDFRDPDPRMRDLDPRFRDQNDLLASDSRPPWGWIAGAIFVFLVLAVIFGSGGSGYQTPTTVGNSPGTTTTGTAPPDNTRPAPPTRPPLAPAPQTGGQGTAQ